MSHDDPVNGGQLTVPDDFRHTLDEVPEAKRGWEMLSTQERNAHLRRLEHQESPVERARVIDASVRELSQQLAGRPSG
jgi:uncharacterized protein YdeI (YjbR/CyaY-like superfamily)